MVTYNCIQCGRLIDSAEPIDICPGCSGGLVSVYGQKLPKELAHEHWAYISELLDKFCDEEMIKYKDEYEFMYKTAFIHGYKHGAERGQDATR